MRCGFWDRAASIGLNEERGVMRCISLHNQTRFPGGGRGFLVIMTRNNRQPSMNQVAIAKQEQIEP